MKKETRNNLLLHKYKSSSEFDSQKTTKDQTKLGNNTMNETTKIRELLCPKEEWVNDKEVNKCTNCAKTFVPLFVWRHHCRFCGLVFCSDCASNTMTGQSIGYSAQKKLRYCDSCKIKIELTKKEVRSSLRKSSLNSNHETNISMIEIQEPDGQITSFDEERITIEGIKAFVIQQKMSLETSALSLLRQLASQLCKKENLQSATWEIRLAQIAWKAAIETKPEMFIRRTPFTLEEEIRVLTIVAPSQAVAAVCVKGLVIEKNIPCKQLQAHMKFPRIVTVKPPIEADSLMKNKQVRFDQIVLNQQKYLKGYMQSLFKLNPTIVFVEGNVSKVAIQICQEKNIMIVPRVRNEDLRKIERLALIKKRLQNLVFIDKNKIAEIIGCCERVYFKTVRQGQNLLFIEHQAGIRTVLLGDASQVSNQTLKKVFLILLRAAWNLKNQRQIICRDTKLCHGNMVPLTLMSIDNYFMEKYISVNNFISSQDISIFKMRYSDTKIDLLQKSFQQYCRLNGRKRMLGPCGQTSWLVSQIYKGEQLSLGSFVLKCATQYSIDCKKCDRPHLYRFYLDNYCVNVEVEQSSSLCKHFRISTNLGQQQQHQDNQMYEDSFKENQFLHTIITKFINIWKDQQLQKHPKLQFKMFFSCANCHQIFGNTCKSYIGNDLLAMSLHHFIYLLIHSHKNKDKIDNQEPQEQTQCKHQNIMRIFQCPRTHVKFSVTAIEKSEIIPIVMNQKMIKRILKRDICMVSELFPLMVNQKKVQIDSLEKQMEQMPFYNCTVGMSTSISIAGNSAIDHVFFWPYAKVSQALKQVRKELQDIDSHMVRHIQQGCRDWTHMMRKFSKIDHVVKACEQIIIYIINALKKEKIEENTPQKQNHCSIEDNFSLANFPVEEPPFSAIKIRKFSTDQSEPLSKSQSIAPSSPYSTFSVTRLRKQTSYSLESQFDGFLKRMRKERFLRFQGAYLYYPIGNIDDAVSLLSCCLNSDQFKQHLKENNYSDYITTKLIFNKQLRTDWSPTPLVLQVYRQVLKQQFYSGQTQQIQFSIYYHKQFQQLRLSEKIDFKLYVRSLYGCQNWDSSGGKSNSTFSKAHNETLVVKIINQKQFIQFQKFAPAYLKYMKQKRDNKQESYLAKIFGIYQVIIKNKVYKCVVMQNIFIGIDQVDRVYDLKGSEVNRLAPNSNDKSFTRLDTNFLIDKDSIPYILEPSVYDKTIQALIQDANFLKEAGVIDYSLLAIESGNNLRLGIIDFMRPYHFVQKIETLYKEIKSGKDPTVIPPHHYADRFIKAMKRYFAKSKSILV